MPAAGVRLSHCLSGRGRVLIDQCYWLTSAKLGGGSDGCGLCAACRQMPALTSTADVWGPICCRVAGVIMKLLYVFDSVEQSPYETEGSMLKDGRNGREVGSFFSLFI